MDKIDIIEISFYLIIAVLSFSIWLRAKKGSDRTKKRIQEIQKKIKEYEQNNRHRSIKQDAYN